MSTVEMDLQPEALAHNMKTVIRTLMVKNGIAVGAMRSMVPMSKNTWLRRMANGDWTAPELVKIASLLGVSVAELFADPSELGFRTGSFLTVLDGDGDATTPPARGHLHPVT